MSNQEPVHLGALLDPSRIVCNTLWKKDTQVTFRIEEATCKRCLSLIASGSEK